MADDFIKDLCERVKDHAARKAPLAIRGGGTKDFYGAPAKGEPLAMAGYAGIVAYEPRELVLVVKAGTRLADIDAALAAQGQMLAVEPPRFGEAATIGGTVACNRSGPRRPYAGAARDFVLGARIVNGKGEDLSFGGRVIKNVAGYDVSRLLAGSLGTLGVLAEVTLKVLPRPMAEQTLVFELGESDAITRLNQWGGQPLPISASFWHQGRLWLRLSGARAAVEAARGKLGGTLAVDAEEHWISVREQTHPAFAGQPLWRLALPSTAPDAGLDGLRAIEWGGAQRWYAGELAAVRGAAARLGGHAVLYRAPESLRCREGAFAPLAPAMLALHRRLKKSFDPRGILNPGRLYAEF